MSTLNSAVRGGLAGASLGTTIAPGIGTAIGAGVGLAAGAIGSEVQKAQQKKKFEREMAFEQDRVNAERRRAVQSAMEMAGQQAGQAQNQIARDSLSATGHRDMGKYIQAQGQVGQGAANTAARATMQAQQQGQAQMEARRAELLQRLEAERARNAQAGETTYAMASAFGEMMREEYPELFGQGAVGAQGGKDSAKNGFGADEMTAEDKASLAEFGVTF